MRRMRVVSIFFLAVVQWVCLAPGASGETETHTLPETHVIETRIEAEAEKVSLEALRSGRFSNLGEAVTEIPGVSGVKRFSQCRRACRQGARLGACTDPGGRAAPLRRLPGKDGPACNDPATRDRPGGLRRKGRPFRQPRPCRDRRPRDGFDRLRTKSRGLLRSLGDGFVPPTTARAMGSWAGSPPSGERRSSTSSGASQEPT